MRSFQNIKIISSKDSSICTFVNVQIFFMYMFLQVKSKIMFIDTIKLSTWVKNLFIYSIWNNS